MPSVSDRQARAMRAAAAGESTIGIPESVGREFVAEDSPFPEYLDAQRGRRTHRGRRSRGKGPEPSNGQPSGDHADHHAEARAHLEKAVEASQGKNPKSATAHLFRALSSLKKC